MRRGSTPPEQNNRTNDATWHKGSASCQLPAYRRPAHVNSFVLHNLSPKPARLCPFMQFSRRPGTLFFQHEASKHSTCIPVHVASRSPRSISLLHPCALPCPGTEYSACCGWPPYLPDPLRISWQLARRAKLLAKQAPRTRVAVDSR
jgi:hypothetical protein